MNAIRTIGVLFASLALFGVAEAQKGGGKPGGGGGDTLSNLNCATDQIARFNGTAWVCSNDRTAAQSFKVTDGNGVEVTYPIVSPIEFYGAYLSADLLIDGQLEPLNLIAYSDRLRPFSNGELAFEAPDCSGQPFFYGNTLYWTINRMFFSVPDSQDEKKFLVFYSARSPVQETIDISSRTDGVYCACLQDDGNGCVPQEKQVVRVDGTVVLNIPYDPPFSFVRD